MEICKGIYAVLCQREVIIPGIQQKQRRKKKYDQKKNNEEQSMSRKYDGATKIVLSRLTPKQSRS